ncbi:hypothetical protein M9Y10_005773 [Tritrichomonas musculus]|uniref:Uncharacterized protein n=1 Tax=Tritrichomonas musculus TaxID=1915356 RepID=A0ABR2JCS0_9EUKA
MSKEAASNNDIRKQMEDMLKDTFEDTECAKDLSSADFLRFISTNKCKETGKQWYEFSSSYLNNEAENYVDKYIDEMAKKYSSN